MSPSGSRKLPLRNLEGIRTIFLSSVTVSEDLNRGSPNLVPVRLMLNWMRIIRQVLRHSSVFGAEKYRMRIISTAASSSGRWSRTSSEQHDETTGQLKMIKCREGTYHRTTKYLEWRGICISVA